MKRKKCRKALKFQEISAFIYSVTVKDGIIYYVLQVCQQKYAVKTIHTRELLLNEELAIKRTETRLHLLRVFP